MAALDRRAFIEAAVRRREVLLSGGVFVVSLAVLLLRFLVPRPIGASDNGDGWRVLCQLHADPIGGPTTDFYVRFLNGWSDKCQGVIFVTTHMWFARIAQWLGYFVGPDVGLNLVLLGCVYSAFAAAAVALLVLGLRLTWRWKVAAAILVLLLVADSGFFGYFASVTTEGAAFLGMVLTVGGMVLMTRTGAWRYVGAGVTIFGGLVLVDAKPQTVMILPMFLVAMVFVRPDGLRGLARWVLPVLVMASVTAGTIMMESVAPDQIFGNQARQINMYHAVFDNIVDGHHDTDADLTALGLPTSWSKYIGTLYWSPNTAVNDPRWPRYADRFTTSNLANYYLHHPVRTVQVMNRAATSLLTVRPDTMGSFSANTGLPPKAQEWRVPVLSGFLRLLAPLGLYALVPLWLLTAIGAIRANRRRVGRRALGVPALLCLAIAISQFVEGGLGEGIEPVKHQVIGAFATLFGLVLVVISLFGGRPDTVEPEPVAERAEPVAEVSR